MIEKLERPTSINWDNDVDSCIQKHKIIADMINKVNELVDVVNKLETMSKNTNTVLKSLVEENNVHEKQIDELQDNQNTYLTDIGDIKAKIAKGFENLKTPVDPFAEQRKWIGKLCWFWDEDRDDAFCDVLGYIFESSRYPYAQTDSSDGYKHCEPVKPDDDIIYKGKIK